MLNSLNNRSANLQRFFLLGILFLMSFSFVIADSGEEHGHEAKFERAEEIINAGISCSELSEEDLESLGEYFMEEMHPGDTHVLMDQRMGGEGSESLKNMHISIGIRSYCDSDYVSKVSFQDGSRYGMMGGGMMMGNYGASSGSSLVYWSVWWIITILIAIILVLIIILLSKKARGKKRR